MPADNNRLEPYNSWPNDQGFDADVDYPTPIELVVTGKIPAYAAGNLYRTGPGGYQVETDKCTTYSASHWFDGFTQVHRFQIIAPTTSNSQIRVLYNSRKTVDKLIEGIRKSGSLDGFTFGQRRDPCESYFKKVMSMFAPARNNKDETNIGVTVSVNLPGLTPNGSSGTEGEGHVSGNRTLWIKTDSSAMKELDPETLEPIGMANQVVLHPDLKGSLSAAHAQLDPLTGDVYNYNLDLGRKSTYRIFCVSASTGNTEIIATVTNVKGAYIHSFLLTENHVILCVWGSHYAYGGASLVWQRNILDAILPFDESVPAKWFVIDRKHGKGVVATYESRSFFCFHTINAWEEPSPTDPSKIDVVADLSVYDNSDVLKRFYYDNLCATSPGSLAFTGQKGDSARAQLKRWRLPAINCRPDSATTCKALVEWAAPKISSVELPTINPTKATHSYRYIYGISDGGASTFLDGLIKFDTHTRQPTGWHYHGQTPGEPIFIADPEGKEEDDGVLLSVVLDGARGKSYLLVLDAKDMKEMGRASMESVVGFGFHGLHVPAQHTTLVST